MYLSAVASYSKSQEDHSQEHLGIVKFLCPVISNYYFYENDVLRVFVSSIVEQ
jgi:hypothetical protein